MMQFYHQKRIDMLKLGFTLPNLANRILHSSTSLKFFPFNQEDEKSRWLHTRLADRRSVDYFHKICESWKFENQKLFQYV